jgi:hypothetical protein
MGGGGGQHPCWFEEEEEEGLAPLPDRMMYAPTNAKIMSLRTNMTMMHFVGTLVGTRMGALERERCDVGGGALASIGGEVFFCVTRLGVVTSLPIEQANLRIVPYKDRLIVLYDYIRVIRVMAHYYSFYP